jgi:hypothetical protein
MATKQTQTPPSETTRFDVFTVEEYGTAGEKQSNWMRIGVAFPHKDGKGFQIQLQAFPVNGKLVLRKHESKPEDRD